MSGKRETVYVSYRATSAREKLAMGLSLGTCDLGHVERK